MITRTPRIPKRKANLLLTCFSKDLTATQAAALARVHRNTANLWYTHFRHRIFEHLRRAPRFSGEVEIDESSFGGRGRKRTAAEKKHKIRSENTKVIVMGILQRGGEIYTHIVKRVDRKTLLPIIHLVVEPGTTIYTDKWRSYDILKTEDYTHEQINHAESFSGKNGVHINSIESFWSFAKRRLSKFNGMSRHTLPLHIKECEFRYNHKDLLKALKKVCL